MKSEELKTAVRNRYGQAARDASGCGAGCGCGPTAANPITTNLYESAETVGVPTTAVLASLGCGNPTALADLRAGEVVLDLGSGGGLDVLLSARRVGPTGKAYGVDMTEEMLELARRNQREAGVTNAEFLQGDIENIPLPDESVDVIVSNCVINLAADKRRVLQEAFRVLKPGGRFAVSDIVLLGEVPDRIRQSVELWMGCIAGALPSSEFQELLLDVGFVDASVEPTRIYGAADAEGFLESFGEDRASIVAAADGKFASAFVRAVKPK